MPTTKEKLRIAFEAGKRQQQVQGNKWYPTKEEIDMAFETWYKQFKAKTK